MPFLAVPQHQFVACHAFVAEALPSAFAEAAAALAAKAAAGKGGKQPQAAKPPNTKQLTVQVREREERGERRERVQL
eukprot:SAG22_NODE_2095_length_3020_cov_2.379664_2_plen_77_part_00